MDDGLLRATLLVHADEVQSNLCSNRACRAVNDRFIFPTQLDLGHDFSSVARGINQRLPCYLTSFEVGSLPRVFRQSPLVDESNGPTVDFVPSPTFL